MQTFVIAVSIVIAGLLGALLICATSLISRARLANTTLRRIEETLLAMNRVRAIDSAVKSADSLQKSRSVDADSAAYLTLRELKMMSGETRAVTEAAPIQNRQKPARYHATPRATNGLPAAPARDSAPDDRAVEVAAQDTPPAAVQGGDNPFVHENLGVVSELVHTAPAANGEMPTQKNAEVVDEATVAAEAAPLAAHAEVATCNREKLSEASATVAPESTAGEDVSASTSNDLDEIRRRKKEQELMMIISSRRRRARASLIDPRRRWGRRRQLLPLRGEHPAARE